MTNDTCCTCANLLSNISPQYDEKAEKALWVDRWLGCCGRIICGTCIAGNHRFASYCPFCQTSTEARSLPESLDGPPEYRPLKLSTLETSIVAEELPAYSSLDFRDAATGEKSPPVGQPAEDVLHFIDASQDTILSLSLRYGVPQDVLRRTNKLFADHLLVARRAILIPGEFYKGGVSLSPQPINGEEEELRKAKIRRWMVACKVAEYDIALLYLEQAKYDLDTAVQAYLADERWEKEHPVHTISKGKMKQSATRNRKLGFNVRITA